MAKQVKLKETPIPLKKEEFEVVYDNPNATKDPDPPDRRQSDPDLFQISAIVKDCEVWGTVIQVAEWANRTGFDITVCGKSGSFQHLSITKEEATIINDVINKLK